MLNKSTFYKLALNSLYYSGLYRAMQYRFSGVGALLTLHHVSPGSPAQSFAPNRILSITPEFLEAAVLQVRELGYETVSLDEAQRRLLEKDFRTRFVSFTLDDGYADNYHHAFPVFAKHSVPFTIYICTGVMDGSSDLWWRGLEDAVLNESRIEVALNGEQRHFETTSTRQKYQAYESIYWSLRGMPLDEQLRTYADIKDRYAGSIRAPDLEDAALSWNMVAEMQRSGLLTIGAHTVNHYALSKLSPREIQDEFFASQETFERQTGVTPRHFAYPYGDAISAAAREFKLADDFGFSTGVTTRKGVLFREHAEHLQALPRISLNGDYQQLRNVRLFLSGLPFALSNGFRKLNVS